MEVLDSSRHVDILRNNTTFLKNVSTESSVIFSLNYKVQSWIYSVRKMLIDYKNKMEHGNVKYYEKSLN